MPLHRLIYCSRTNGIDEGDIEQILQACERNNLRDNLSGMLLFTSDFFLQLLEGDRSAVSARFRAIAGDSRHRDVEVISSGAVDFRLFERWRMHYQPCAMSLEPTLRRYSAHGGFDPYDMSSSAVEQLCLDWSVRAMQEELS